MKKVLILAGIIILILLNLFNIGYILFRPEKVVFVCNHPYIQVGSECCLDQDSNAICDAEEPPAPEPVVEEPTESVELEEIEPPEEIIEDDIEENISEEPEEFRSLNWTSARNSYIEFTVHSIGLVPEDNHVRFTELVLSIKNKGFEFMIPIVKVSISDSIDTETFIFGDVDSYFYSMHGREKPGYEKIMKGEEKSFILQANTKILRAESGKNIKIEVMDMEKDSWTYTARMIKTDVDLLNLSGHKEYFKRSDDSSHSTYSQDSGGAPFQPISQ